MTIDLLARVLGLPDEPAAFASEMTSRAVARRTASLALLADHDGWTPSHVDAVADLLATGGDRDAVVGDPSFGGWLHAAPASGGVASLTSLRNVLQRRSTLADRLPFVGSWRLDGADPLLHDGSAETIDLVRSPEDRDRWTDGLGAAAAVLATVAPASSTIAASTISAIVPLRQTDGRLSGRGRDEIRSGTQSYGFGALALSLGRGDAGELARVVVHEMHHGFVNELLGSTELVGPGAGEAHLPSPWKTEPRPIEAIVHGVVAFWSEVEFLTSAYRAHDGSDVDGAVLEALTLVRGSEVDRAAVTALTSGELGRDGEHLVEAIRTRLVEIGAARPARHNRATGIGGFLDGWDAPAPPSAGPEVSDDGNISVDGASATYVGHMVGRRHPDFGRFIEPGVRDLVDVVVGDLDLVTYSSCEGHRYPSADRAPGLRMVGVLPRSDDELRRASVVLLAAIRRARRIQPSEVGARAIVTVDRLEGETPTERWTTVDLQFVPVAGWDRYFADLDAVTSGVVAGVRAVLAARREDVAPAVREQPPEVGDASVS